MGELFRALHRFAKFPGSPSQSERQKERSSENYFKIWSCPSYSQGRSSSIAALPLRCLLVVHLPGPPWPILHLSPGDSYAIPDIPAVGDPSFLSNSWHSSTWPAPRRKVRSCFSKKAFERPAEETACTLLSEKDHS